jgi:hypothetical protein
MIAEENSTSMVSFSTMPSSELGRGKKSDTKGNHRVHSLHVANQKSRIKNHNSLINFPIFCEAGRLGNLGWDEGISED